MLFRILSNSPISVTATDIKVILLRPAVMIEREWIDLL